MVLYFKVLLLAVAMLMSTGCANYNYIKNTDNVAPKKLGYNLPADASPHQFENWRRGANVNRLEAEPVYGDSVHGLRGWVINERNESVTYVVRDCAGVKVLQGLLAPAGKEGSIQEQYLLPTRDDNGYSDGRYNVTIKCSTGTWSSKFAVSALTDNIAGREGHWHILLSWYAR
jgi:hypothetical protein